MESGSYQLFRRNDAVNCTKDGILEIPEGFSHLDIDFAYFVVREDLPKVHTLIIPKTVVCIDTMRGDASMGPYGYRNNPFSKIIVDEENPIYCSKDGVLYSKDMKELICYPCGKAEKVFHIPEGVEKIGSEAFLNVEHLETVIIPNSISCIEERAFCACEQVDFPYIVGIYISQQKTIITILVISECDYRKNTEVCYLLLTEQLLESISEKEFSDYQSYGMSLVYDYTNRREIMKRIWTFVETLNWIADHDDLAECLTKFKNVFYSDEY